MLLDGLNITIFNYKDISEDNIEFRIDSEYYQKEYLHIYEKLRGSETLGELVYMTDVSSNGAFAYVHNILNDNNKKVVPYIRSGNVGNTFINTSELELISQEAHQKLPKSSTSLHDVMMARKGKIGGASIIMEDEVNFNCNENVIKLTIHNSGYNPFYFTTFFNSKFGLKQVERISTGNVQPWVSIFQIKKLLIPKLDNLFQQKIENIVRQSHGSLIIAKQKYTEAETLLLENLGLQNFQETKQSVNIKSLKDSFLQTGRLDAEFYQPIYEQLESKIKNYPNGFERLSYFIDNYSTGYPYQSETYTDIGVPLIRINNINSGRLDMSHSVCIPKSDIDLSTKDIANENDVLISMSGTIGNSCVVPKGLKAVVNQRIMRITPKNIQVEILPLILNSLIGKFQLERIGTGGVQTNISANDIKDIFIPKIAPNIQEKIANYIRQSNELREQAYHLLATAKNQVETEIENNSLNINKLETRGGGVDPAKPQVLLARSYHFARLAEWTLLEHLLFNETKNISIYSFSQSFGASGRLDAEYYQPKFAKLFSQLAKFKTARLGDIVDLRKSIEPGSDAYQTEGIPFVRVSDLSKFGISQTDKYLNAADFVEVIRPKKDTILLTKDGTVGIAYKVPKDTDVITSGAIVHLSLKTDQVLPDYLTLVLNSPAVRLQAERDAGGSIIQHWKPSEILDVMIPILPKAIQQEISQKVQESFKLKQESEYLLNNAKIMVESEIEKEIKF